MVPSSQIPWILSMGLLVVHGPRLNTSFLPSKYLIVDTASFGNSRSPLGTIWSPLGTIFFLLYLPCSKWAVFFSSHPGTSGDTGSAAIESVQGAKNVDIIVLLPKGHCTKIQELQMTTVLKENVRVFAGECRDRLQGQLLEKMGWDKTGCWLSDYPFFPSSVPWTVIFSGW